MWEALRDGLEQAYGLGKEPGSLTILQVSLRAATVFVFGVGVIRIGNKRFLGKSTPLDVLLSVLLGAVLGRTINGSAPFVPTLFAGGVLVLLHRFLAAAAFRSPRLGSFVKGHPRLLVEDGKLHGETAARCHISSRDLEEALRLSGSGARLEEVDTVVLERSGDISVRKKKGPPKVLEVKVEAGVQTIRIEVP